MQHELVSVIRWPYCQICMDCQHGVFIQGEGYESSDHICRKAVVDMDGITCSEKEAKDEE